MKRGRPRQRLRANDREPALKIRLSSFRLVAGFHSIIMLCMTTALIYDTNCLMHETGHHPESPARFSVILEALEGDAALWPQLAKLAPREASDQEITRC